MDQLLRFSKKNWKIILIVLATLISLTIGLSFIDKKTKSLDSSCFCKDQFGKSYKCSREEHDKKFL